MKLSQKIELGRNTKKLLVLFVFVILGFGLSVLSGSFSLTRESVEQQYCIGPAVPNYKCPDLPTVVTKGLPIPYITTRYSYGKWPFPEKASEVTQDSNLLFVANSIFLAAILYLPYKLIRAKQKTKLSKP